MATFYTHAAFLFSRLNQITTALHGPLTDGPTLPQTEILLTLSLTGPVSQTDMARAAVTDRSTVSTIVSNLVHAGLIERGSSPHDRRKALLAIPPGAAAQAEQARAAYLRLQDILCGRLDDGDRAFLLDAMLRIASTDDAPGPEWRPEPHILKAMASWPGFLVRRCLQVCEAQILDQFAELDLTPRQFSLLILVSALGPVTQIELARTFGLDPATCRVILRRLLDRDLLRSEMTRSDRRQRALSITPAGEEVLCRAQPLADISETRSLAPLSPSERDRLVSIMQRLIGLHQGSLRFPGLIV
jgi:DNA-binding MarR family transcriptional regulator